MTIHRPHPIDGPWPYRLRDPGREDSPINRAPDGDARIFMDPDGAVLYDGCERCAEHAERPFVSLDDDNLARLIGAAIGDGLAYPIPPQPTTTQQRACTRIREDWIDANAVLSRVRRITGSLPGWMVPVGGMN